MTVRQSSDGMDLRSCSIDDKKLLDLETAVTQIPPPKKILPEDIQDGDRVSETEVDLLQPGYCKTLSSDPSGRRKRKRWCVHWILYSLLLIMVHHCLLSVSQILILSFLSICPAFHHPYMVEILSVCFYPFQLSLTVFVCFSPALCPVLDCSLPAVFSHCISHSIAPQEISGPFQFLCFSLFPSWSLSLSLFNSFCLCPGRFLFV